MKIKAIFLAFLTVSVLIFGGCAPDSEVAEEKANTQDQTVEEKIPEVERELNITNQELLVDLDTEFETMDFKQDTQAQVGLIYEVEYRSATNEPWQKGVFSRCGRIEECYGFFFGDNSSFSDGFVKQVESAAQIKINSTLYKAQTGYGNDGVHINGWSKGGKYAFLSLGQTKNDAKYEDDYTMGAQNQIWQYDLANNKFRKGSRLD